MKCIYLKSLLVCFKKIMYDIRVQIKEAIMKIIILSEINVWGQIGLIALGVLIGAIAGFFISRAVFKKQLKKNPPVNEKMIRALYMQMGRKPSEAQVRAAMKAMNQYK